MASCSNSIGDIAGVEGGPIVDTSSRSVRVSRFLQQGSQPCLVGQCARLARKVFQQPLGVPPWPIRVLAIRGGKRLMVGWTDLAQQHLPGFSQANTAFRQAITGIFSIASRTFSSGYA